jgi:hypothetical protein
MRPFLPLLPMVLLAATPALAKDLTALDASPAAAEPAQAAEPGSDMPIDWSLYVPETNGNFLTWGETPPELGLVKRMFQFTYTEPCNWALGGGGGGQPEPEVYDLEYRYSYETADEPAHPLKLYRFFCNAGAYNEVHVYMTWDASSGLEALSFAQPDLDIAYAGGDSLEGAVESITIRGMTSTLMLVNSWFDPETQTIYSDSHWRGLADASSQGTYAFREGGFVLATYDVDASYDGEQNPFRVIDYSAPAPLALIPGKPTYKVYDEEE